MAEFSLWLAVSIGLAGGVHCVGMCGGVVGAFGYLVPTGKSVWRYTLAYNAGRVTSYAVAGAIAGGIGGTLAGHWQGGVSLLKIISGVLLILMGCYIGHWWRILTQLERAGKHLWTRIHPLSKRFVPLRTAWYAVPYGMIWGWLPCGLVYSALTWSLASGSALTGMLWMLGFGLGTLPTLLLLGASGASLRHFLQHPITRQVVAASLVLFGVLTIAMALGYRPSWFE